MASRCFQEAPVQLKKNQIKVPSKTMCTKLKIDAVHRLCVVFLTVKYH